MNDMSDHGDKQEIETSGWLSDERISWPADEIRRSVTDRREWLYEAMYRLETALARPSGLADWRIEIEAALAFLEEALEAHVAEVEGEDGLFAQLTEDAHHLISGIETLRTEHTELLTACRTALSRAVDWATPTLRRRANVLLGRLAIHRQYGADLLFEAYNTDLGAGG